MTLREVYTHGYGRRTREWMAQRRADEAAAFLLPHLRPGMRLLDCGCGPGSITVDLATLVAPGEVIGIDIEQTQVDAARALADDRRVRNLRFQVASIYDLPFEDASFDAVLAHTVVEHLAQPQAAFIEVRRILKPSGVFGVRDPEYSTWRTAPASPALDAFAELIRRVQEFNGGSPYYAPHQRELLLEAGFARTEAGATAMYLGNGDQMAFARSMMEEQFGEAAFVEAATQSGYTPAALHQLWDELEAWSRRPDSFLAILMCHALGWAS